MRKKMIDKKQKNDFLIGIAATLVFSAVTLIGLIFHEPFFDEAQAYLIARDASLDEIILYLTHYEGHPPLWHIILKGAAALGFSFEFTLKAVNFIIFEVILILIQFRSPFSRLTRIIIPSSYFIMYQYSVISRPYILVMLAAVTAAICYKERSDKPVRYILALLFMCLCHSYGIAMAGGIVVSDLLGECIRKRSVKKTAAGLLKNKRLFICYIALFIAALLIIYDILPYSDAYASQVVRTKNHSRAVIFLFSWLLIPSEALITSFSSENISMQAEVNPLGEVIGAAAISLIVWGLLFMICKKRKMTAEMIIPYLFISFLTSAYVFPHHYGIFVIYLLFILWTAGEKEKITFTEIASPLEKAGLSEKLVKTAAVCGTAAFTAVNLYWNGMSYYSDITKKYDSAGELADWIKENELADRKILMTWTEDDTNMYTSSAIAANAYFDDNIFCNSHDGLTYITHIVPDKAELEADREEMKNAGKPYLMVCASPIEIDGICRQIGVEDSFNAIAFEGKAEKTFKDKREDNSMYVMCTRETYKEIYGKDYRPPVFEK